ncbi:TadE/TadG family type IV pilus assembly protein [Agromyces sp. NPDC058110]|uniref:TadE/TadG family type IV pilus assembly protein n=1 Tax=Agromyces sp. NPDC058110 TaxID=3346345 RepID=UPI0036D782D8
MTGRRLGLAWSRLADDRGSAVAEFTMVGALLIVLVLAVVQLALALHVRNTLLDAAAEGARFASLAGSSAAEGAARTRELIDTAISAEYARDVRATTTSIGGTPAIEVRVRSVLPVIGLLGVANGLEVAGHAPLETIG